MSSIGDTDVGTSMDPLGVEIRADDPRQRTQRQVEETQQTLQQNLTRLRDATNEQWRAMSQEWRTSDYAAVAQRGAMWLGGFVLVRGTLRTLTGASRARRARQHLADDLIAVLATSQRPHAVSTAASRVVAKARSRSQE